MAFDGAFLHRIQREIEQAGIGAKVDKVAQPSRDELILTLRGRESGGRLLLSANANSPRVQLTAESPENPAVPPMFCMLLRKRLCGGRLTAVRQPELERVLLLDFDCINELGDHVTYTLAVEIMGRYSNIVLVCGGQIVDAIKRVTADMTSERLVLPGLAYELPPPQEKWNILTHSNDEILSRLAAVRPAPLHKALLSVLQGVSPVVCSELQFRAAGDEARSDALTPAQQEKLCDALDALRREITDGATVEMVRDEGGKPIDFSFFPLYQYDSAAVTRMDSASELLDAFYAQRDRMERMRTRAHDLLHILAQATDKLSRKINLQRGELEACGEREELRVCADLLNANLYRLTENASFADVENFYEPDCPIKRIPLDPALSPSRNAQKYYKEYRKAQTAEEMLTTQIAQATAELAYLDTVSDALSRAQTERELQEIRQELADQGYLRRSTDRRRPLPLLKALRFTTSDGFQVLVGRNNRENDQLTLRQAADMDYWFHVKNIPGSHTILVTNGVEPSEQAITEAAQLAAFHSKASASAQVPVDYTRVRHVHKPQGAKPGMVIYDHYRTAFVTPSAELTQRLAENP